MDTDRLRIFLECARLGNFSRAAEALHLSQPSISLHIRQLEDWCGTNLFQRRGRRVELTEAGRVLREHAQRVLVDLDAARHVVREISGLGGGRLAVGGAGLPGTYLLPKALSMFKALHPNLEIFMKFGVSSDIQPLLKDDVVELAMFSRKPKTAGLVYESFATSAMVAAAPAGHPDRKSTRLNSSHVS